MSSLFAPEPKRIIIDDASKVAAFVQLRLQVTVAQLFQALDIGMAEAAVTTEHSSAVAFGTRLWDGCLTSLRDQLAPDGWTVQRPGGLEVVRRPDKAVQITPSLGTENVGVVTGVNPRWVRMARTTAGAWRVAMTSRAHTRRIHAPRSRRAWDGGPEAGL